MQSRTRFVWFKRFLWLLLIPTFLFASSGKIRGTIIHKETGIPVSGAEVHIENYSLKAISDINGEYILLNVPAGSHTIIVYHADYEEIRFENVVVRSGLTTYQDLVLSGDKCIIQVDPVRIEKDETGDVQTFRREEIERLPLRDVEDVLSIMAGVVHLDDNFHIRGGRHDELGWMVDGFNVSDAFDGDPMIQVIPNAIEEITLHPGNFSAEYGGKMSGMADITLKTGGPIYKITGEIISDDFWAFKDKRGAYEILGIDKLYSYGYSDYVLTASGPVLPKYDKLRFFIAGQRRNRLSDATWFQGFQQDPIQLIGKWTTWHWEQIVDTLNLYLDVPPGRLPGGGSSDLTVQGNLLWDFKPFRLKVGGTWSQGRSTPQTSDPQKFISIGTRDPRTHTGSWNGYFNLTQHISPTFYYSLSGSYTKKHWESGDPLMGWDKDSWIDWGDPIINPTLIDTSQATGAYPLPFDPNFRISYPGSPVYAYEKGEEEKYSLRFDLTKQLGRNHEVKLGGEYHQTKFRAFRFRARDFLKRLRDVGLNPASYSEFDIYNPLVDMWGYDWFGNEIEKDMIVETKIGFGNWRWSKIDESGMVIVNLRNRPPTPTYAGFYLQDRIELKDIILNIGLRFEHFDNGISSLQNLVTLIPGQTWEIDDQNWEEPRRYSYLTPRLGLNFPIGNRIQFHANYGEYFQTQSIEQIWTLRGYRDFLEKLYSGMRFGILPNPNLKPSRSVLYEIGSQIKLGNKITFDITAYHREISDWTGVEVLLPEVFYYRSPAFISNNGYSSIKGITTRLHVVQLPYILVDLQYSFDDVKGSGSSYIEHFTFDPHYYAIGWWQESEIPPTGLRYPLIYSVNHSGTFLISACSQPKSGPYLFGTYPFSDLTLSLKFEFRNGKRYTRIPIGDAFTELYGYSYLPPHDSPNASRFPWFFQLDGKLDKAFCIGRVKFNIYLWVVNILGTKGIVDGFRQTGRPDTDGWLGTLSGQEKIAEMGEYAEEYIKWYNAILTGCGTFGYQQPRQVRLGVKFELF